MTSVFRLDINGFFVLFLDCGFMAKFELFDCFRVIYVNPILPHFEILIVRKI